MRRAQQKAKEAVVAVSAVETASQQMSRAQANATNTLGALQEAAQVGAPLGLEGGCDAHLAATSQVLDLPLMRARLCAVCVKGCV